MDRALEGLFEEKWQFLKMLFPSLFLKCIHFKSSTALVVVLHSQSNNEVF